MQKARRINGHIRVMVVDDHELVRRGISLVLDGVGGIEIIGSAGDLQGALALVEEARPDVALVDVTMPVLSGVDLVREFRLRAPRMRNILLTGTHDHGIICEAINAGAIGVMTKSDGPERLVRGIHRAASGLPLHDEQTMARAREMGRISEEMREALKALTTQEAAVVDLVADGLTNAEIAERLHLAEKTVRNYVSHVLTKVGLSNRTQLATQVTRIASLGLIPSGAR